MDAKIVDPFAGGRHLNRTQVGTQHGRAPLIRLYVSTDVTGPAMIPSRRVPFSTEASKEA